VLRAAALDLILLDWLVFNHTARIGPRTNVVKLPTDLLARMASRMRRQRELEVRLGGLVGESA